MIPDNYECDGQMSIEDWLEDREKVRDLDIKGLCDDPYCPECGYLFTTYGSHNEALPEPYKGESEG